LAATPLGIPTSVFVFLLVALALEQVLRSTKIGREMFLIGENRRAAIAAALPVARVTVVAFALAGAAAAVAGVVLGATNQNGSLLLSGTLTFDAIAAVLVGGTAVSGGKGSVGRTVLGAIWIGLISDLLLLRGYDTGVQIGVKGLAILGAVMIVESRQRSGAR